MKKLIITAALITQVISESYGFLYVNWQTLAGIIRPDYSPLFSSPSGTALFQLIFTPDTVIGPALPNGATSDNDVVLDQYTVSPPGGIDLWAYGFSEIYGMAPYMAGYLYIRVFEEGTSIGNVPVGALYLDGPLFATINNPGPPNVPDDVNIGWGGPGPYGEFPLNQTVVPEPSILTLALLGAGVIGIRRIRRT